MAFTSPTSDHRILLERGVENRQSFHNEARFQRVCAVCGAMGGYHAHHVVYEQVLKRTGLLGKALYNTLNSLRLCVRCHERHHNGTRKVPTTKLRDDNLLYAFVVLGSYAADWLRRYYDDSDADPRIAAYEATGVLG